MICFHQRDTGRATDGEMTKFEWRFKSEARMNDEGPRTQIRGPGELRHLFVRSPFVLRHFLYAFYKLVDDRPRENSLSHHG